MKEKTSVFLSIFCLVICSWLVMVGCGSGGSDGDSNSVTNNAEVTSETVETSVNAAVIAMNQSASTEDLSVVGESQEFIPQNNQRKLFAEGELWKGFVAQEDFECGTMTTTANITEIEYVLEFDGLGEGCVFESGAMTVSMPLNGDLNSFDTTIEYTKVENINNNVGNPYVFDYDVRTF